MQQNYNENFDDKLDAYIHHYKIVHTLDNENVMEGLEFVFIELQAKKFTDKRLQVLWLRFLSEINDSQESISQDFLDVPELKEASDLILESGFTKGELETYDKYWDYISTEKTVKADAFENGVEKGIEKGIKNVAENLKKAGMPFSDITKATGLSEQEIEIL